MASELALLLAISFRGPRRPMLAGYLIISLLSAALYGFHQQLYNFMAVISDLGKLLLFLGAWLLATEGLMGDQRLRFALGCVVAGFVPVCAALEMQRPTGGAFIGFHAFYLLWIAGACAMIPAWLGHFDIWTYPEDRQYLKMLALLMCPKALAVLAQAQSFVALPFWGVDIACELAMAAVLLLWVAKVLHQPRRQHRHDDDCGAPEDRAPVSTYLAGHAPPGW